MAKPTWARQQALKVIHQVSSRQAFARPLIDTHIRTAEAPAAERDYAIRLILGITQSVGELDLIIQRTTQARQTSPLIRDILRLAAYELAFLAKEPYVAVDQAVALAQAKAPHAAGFVNWAVRRISEDLAGFPWGDPADSLDALAHAEAFPLWLAELLVDQLGYDAAQGFMAVANQPAPVFAQDLTTGECLVLAPGQLAEAQAQIAAGELIIADLGTQGVARLVAAQAMAYHDCRLLEVGSGRGTKTVLVNRHLQRDYPGHCQHLAIDNLDFKVKALAERIAQYRLQGVTALTQDALRLDGAGTAGGSEQSAALPFQPGSYDLVFIDAPCSGSGTLRRHPEIRWRLTAADVSRMATQGLAFIQAAAPLVKPGGSLLYATCSVLREENESVVEAFLACPSGQGFELEPLSSAAASPQLIPDAAASPQPIPDAAASLQPISRSPYFKSSQLAGAGDGDAHFAALLRKAS